jgi:hypothetical protein
VSCFSPGVWGSRSGGGLVPPGAHHGQGGKKNGPVRPLGAPTKTKILTRKPPRVRTSYVNPWSLARNDPLASGRFNDSQPDPSPFGAFLSSPIAQPALSAARSAPAGREMGCRRVGEPTSRSGNFVWHRLPLGAQAAAAGCRWLCVVPGPLPMCDR